MHEMTSIRARIAALAILASLCSGTVALAQRSRPVVVQFQRQYAPPPPPPMQRRGPGMGANRVPHGEHLAEWMNQHNNLTPAQQQQALDREPGFRELPPQTQQREHERLAQLNAMNPQQRQRILNRNEYMERLSPDQRGQVRGAMQQLGSLPPEDRRIVARNFRELRGLPQEQRYPAMNRMPLTEPQRSTLNNLMRVEPMLPPPEPR
jgi:hypothetical protein